ncbi:hypothetical protein GCM10010394_52250 [Streptomyces crystallinus]|uniref:Uncharacterized protein n=1 Tax=Streptomyces crystallinus TaxID=68191 RepID=A0ABP3RXE8_9ACTN
MWLRRIGLGGGLGGGGCHGGDPARAEGCARPHPGLAAGAGARAAAPSTPVWLPGLGRGPRRPSPRFACRRGLSAPHPTPSRKPSGGRPGCHLRAGGGLSAQFPAPLKPSFVCGPWWAGRAVPRAPGNPRSSAGRGRLLAQFPAPLKAKPGG